MGFTISTNLCEYKLVTDFSMTKRLDTSWFDLKNYEPFKTMTIEEWIWQLEIRCDYYEDVRMDILPPGEELETLEIMLAELKAGVIPKYNRRLEKEGKSKRQLYPFSTSSFNSLTSYELWDMAEDEFLKNTWLACKHVHNVRGDGNADESLFKIAHTPHDLNISSVFPPWYDTVRNAHVKIDLTATDEQIKNDFEYWLTNYRKTVGYKKQKKLFSQKDFDYWIEYSVIPYLDLVLISKIEGKNITQNKIAQLIFPNEFDVEIVGRLRKVTKPTAKWLLDNEIHKTLAAQLAYEKVERKK